MILLVTSTTSNQNRPCQAYIYCKHNVSALTLYCEGMVAVVHCDGEGTKSKEWILPHSICWI